MSTQAHTPGPWHAKVDDLVPERGAVYIEGPDGWDTQAICDCRYSDEGVERDEANARLIAAAPDLLAALKQAEPFLRRFGSSAEAAAVEASLAAIRKAGGRL